MFFLKNVFLILIGSFFLFSCTSTPSTNLDEYNEPLGPKTPSQPGQDEEMLDGSEQKNLPQEPVAPLQTDDAISQIDEPPVDQNFVSMCVKTKTAIVRQKRSSASPVLRKLTKGECVIAKASKSWAIVQGGGFILIKNLEVKTDSPNLQTPSKDSSTQFEEQAPETPLQKTEVGRSFGPNEE